MKNDKKTPVQKRKTVKGNAAKKISLLKAAIIGSISPTMGGLTMAK